MPDVHSTVSIETSFAHPWQEEQSLSERLYEWMNAAPWVMISLAAHLLLFFIAATIPWQEFEVEEKPPFIQAILPPEQLPFEEPPVEIPPNEEVEVPSDEPTLQPSDEQDDSSDLDSDHSEDFDRSSDYPVDFDPLTAVENLGLGPRGDGGHKYGPRVGGGQKSGAIERALEDGLAWLTHHQAEDGSWDADGFDAECGSLGTNHCDGTGYPEHDVGVTGLALLAFLGMGSDSTRGEYREVIKRGMRYLKTQQDPESGLIGDRTSREFIYNHAIATLALCEDYYFTRNPSRKKTAQRAIDFITRARDPYGVWRYDIPSLGEGDTSVTGWMIFALTSARDAGLKVDTGAFDSALAFFDEMTDDTNGRVGYLSMGSASSRIPGLNQHYPVENGEAMTAVALLSRVFLGQEPAELAVMEKHADLLLRALPKWEPEERGCDMYYWYYGTYAMFQMGAHKTSYWKKWEATLDAAVIQTQRKDGDEKGSWDPVGPWGFAGGRVYSTALMVLTLEVKFRYARVLGTR